jgi:hypothetical protein
MGDIEVTMLSSTWLVEQETISPDVSVTAVSPS